VAAELDLKEESKHITIPTLLGWGLTDATVSLAEAVKYYDRIPNSSLYVCTKACHNWLITRPEEYLVVLRDFVNRPEGFTRTISIDGKATFRVGPPQHSTNNKQD
jgi:pimeloyl-ACP methyl ester carboxylesterase